MISRKDLRFALREQGHPSQDNLIYNPGAETNRTDEWSAGRTDTTIQNLSTDPNTGTRHFSFTVRQNLSDTIEASGNNQYLRVFPGRVTLFGGHMKYVGTAPDQVKLGIKYFDVDQNMVLNKNKAVTITNSYTDVFFLWDTPHNAEYARPYIYIDAPSGSDATLYVDDIYFINDYISRTFRITGSKVVTISSAGTKQPLLDADERTVGIKIYAPESNSGTYIYVGDSTLDVGNGVWMEKISKGNGAMLEGINNAASRIYGDADTSGDKIVVTKFEEL